MKQELAQISIVVRDYDEAISFYTRVLNFNLLEDTVLSPEKRWVRVAPPGSTGCGLLLAKGVGQEQQSRIGNQTGGRVFLFLHTDDLERDHQSLIGKGVDIVRGPSVEEYGKVLVFRDLYGNLWDLIQPSSTY
jgi:catechol 2,3-dioxygenase-like lactoylglutathione lyase family enzyme